MDKVLSYSLTLQKKVGLGGSRPQSWLAGPQVWLAGPQARLDGPLGGGGQMVNLLVCYVRGMFEELPIPDVNQLVW